MGQHCKGNFLAKCWSTQIKETRQITLQCKIVYGVVVQHYTGNFLVRCWHRQTQTIFPRLLSCALDQHCKNNFLCNIAPAWSIQYFIYYFPHKNCLIAMSQHYISKNFVQCCPIGSRQHCTGQNHVQCCLNILFIIGTTSHR